MKYCTRRHAKKTCISCIFQNNQTTKTNPPTKSQSLLRILIHSHSQENFIQKKFKDNLRRIVNTETHPVWMRWRVEPVMDSIWQTMHGKFVLWSNLKWKLVSKWCFVFNKSIKILLVNIVTFKWYNSDKAKCGNYSEKLDIKFCNGWTVWYEHT